ncbi:MULTISPECIES: AraC family transcriptional regulator [Cupriavidus]|nr:MULTISPECIES: AraC family transcriptional regulator [Cupriavidus]WKA45379.1 AraC family transcriptional regulator [Cupriavidus necator]
MHEDLSVERLADSVHMSPRHFGREFRLNTGQSPARAVEQLRVETARILAARKIKIALPENVAIDAEVDLGMAGDAYCLQARLNVHVPGVERETAEALAHEAHQTCPYSKATRGNIDVTINVV